MITEQFYNGSIAESEDNASSPELLSATIPSLKLILQWAKNWVLERAPVLGSEDSSQSPDSSLWGVWPWASHLTSPGSSLSTKWVGGGDGNNI